MATMNYNLDGEYKAKLIGKTITFDANLGKRLKDWKIGYLFFTKEKQGRLNIVHAHTKKPEKDYIRVKVEDGKFKSPKISRKKLKEMIGYADLENEIIIMGFLDYLQIWNKEKLDKYAPPLSGEDWKNVPKELYDSQKNLKLIH